MVSFSGQGCPLGLLEPCRSLSVREGCIFVDEVVQVVIDSAIAVSTLSQCEVLSHNVGRRCSADIRLQDDLRLPDRLSLTHVIDGINDVVI